MFKNLFFLLLSLFGLTTLTLGQLDSTLNNKENITFIGKVSGVSAKKFLVDKSHDSRFGLLTLTDSKYLIEIRFFEFTNIPRDYCTILYYDSGFKLKRYHYQRSLIDSNKLYMTEYQPLYKMNADSILRQLVQNSIFSYVPSEYWDSRPKVLTTQDIIDDKKFCGQTDGSWYYINIKVGNVFRQIVTRSDRRFQSECFPDNSDFKKEAAFIELLEARPLIRTK